MCQVSEDDISTSAPSSPEDTALLARRLRQAKIRLGYLMAQPEEVGEGEEISAEPEEGEGQQQDTTDPDTKNARVAAALADRFTGLVISAGSPLSEAEGSVEGAPKMNNAESNAEEKMEALLLPGEACLRDDAWNVAASKSGSPYRA